MGTIRAFIGDSNVEIGGLLVILIAILMLLLAFRIRRSFCEILCPVGTLSNLILKLEGLLYKNDAPHKTVTQKNHD